MDRPYSPQVLRISKIVYSSLSTASVRPKYMPIPILLTSGSFRPSGRVGGSCEGSQVI